MLTRYKYLATPIGVKMSDIVRCQERSAIEDSKNDCRSRETEKGVPTLEGKHTARCVYSYSRCPPLVSLRETKAPSKTA